MAERKEGQHPERPSQEQLKDGLLSRRISAGQFLEAVMELDQATSARDHAEENIHLLTEPAVFKILEQATSSLDELHNLLSLSYFHVAQRKLLGGDNSAKVDFEKSLQSAEKIQNEDYRGWKDYVQATLSYMNQDIGALEEILSSIEEGPNKNIILNMIAGLKRYGNVDYKRDYKNVIE